MSLQTDKSSKKNKGSPQNHKKKKVNTGAKKGGTPKKTMPGIIGRIKGKFIVDEDALNKMHKDILADID